MEENFPFHLLSQDLQMYIFAQDPGLLLIASYLSKSFYTRARSYLYTQFRDQPISHHKIINYITTRWPSKWYRIEHNPHLTKVEAYERNSTGEEYLVTWRYHFYLLFGDYNLFVHPNNNSSIYFNTSRVERWFGPKGLFDLITLSHVLAQRTICCQLEPNYIRNYLLHYLATLRLAVGGLQAKQMLFFAYLVLNLVLYGQERYPDHTYWTEEIEELIESKYEKLVTYIQNN